MVKIDKELCIGCGTCAAISPNVFKINDADGKAEVINQDDAEGAKNGVESCPVQAITL